MSLFLNSCTSPLENHVDYFSKPHAYNTSEREFMTKVLSVMYWHDQNGTEFREDFMDFSTIIPTMNRTNIHAQLQMETGLDAICDNNTLDMATYEYIENISFWVEGVSQFVVGIFGIISNLLMIPILSSTSMRSIFNRLLACLLMIHTVYIMTTLTIYIGQTEWIGGSKEWFNILFPFVLHPLRPLMLYSSSFITVLMARQRYLAIRHPWEYRNLNLNTNPWIPALQSLVLVLVASTLFVTPLFFETSITKVYIAQVKDINGTHFQYVSKYGGNSNIYTYLYLVSLCT